MSKEPTDATGERSASVHIRVHLLGRFQLEWVDPLSGQITPLPPNACGDKMPPSSSLGLLKALLTRPDRFATRAWLLEQFWPDSRHRSAEERLTDVVSSLRVLLRPTGSTDMLVHFVHGVDGRGAGFRLDTYLQLWCDADAFEWYVTHAILLDQRGQDATACWERAFTLAARGMYLPEQMEDDWTRPRRDHLNGLLRDCVQRWTQVLRQAGQGDEALMRLRAYWLTHLTDEDALRPLLELLGERERFQEAEESYAKARSALSEDGHVPDARTDETIEVVRALKVRRRPNTEIFAAMAALPHFALPTIFPPQENRTFFSSIKAIAAYIIEILCEWNNALMMTFDPSKRASLQQMIAASGAIGTNRRYFHGFLEKEEITGSRPSSAVPSLDLDLVSHYIDSLHILLPRAKDAISCRHLKPYIRESIKRDVH